MSDLANFLAWFEGFAENIDGAPSEKQWGRIRDRIASLTVPSAGSCGPAAISAPPPPARPTTKAGWKAAYTEAAVNLGADLDTAMEMAGETVIDLSRDPAEAAKADIRAMTGD